MTGAKGAPPAGRPSTITPPSSEAIATNRTGRAGVAADRYSDGTLARWTASRERVGGRLVLHLDPQLSAELLAEALGGRAAAARWALALVAEVGRP